MDIPELREELHDYINHADERFLKRVYAMSIEYKISETIGYNSDQTEITHKNLRDRVKKASQRVKNGDFISQDELEKEIENW